MKKRLLFITWSVSYGYGTEKSLADVLCRMNREVYEISVLPLFKNSKETILDEQRIRVLDALIDYTEENFDEKASLEYYYSLLANPLQFNRRINEKYDCVIACNHNAPSYFASYINGGAKVVWIRGDMQELDYREIDRQSAQYKQIKQEHETQADVLRSFDAIVVISDIVQKTLKDLFNITENVVKIPNSVDGEKIRRLSKANVALPDKQLFTTLGRLDYNKNQILLLQAAEVLKKQRADFMIYLLGDGDDRRKLERYIEEHRLGDNVRILGFVDNPYPYIKASTATVLTSRSEGFSLALVESVVLDTPIISTDVGVAGELIKKYSCGEMVDYDAQSISGAMLQHMNKYDGCKPTFGLGDDYDIKTEVRKTEEIIDEAIHRIRLKKKDVLPYPVITIDEHELDAYEIKKNEMYVLRVMKDRVPFEYLIHSTDSDKLIVFNNGAVVGGNVDAPIFQRHSWAKNLETSSIFCMDPTLYLNRTLQLGWGIGKNEHYYLESSSLILKKIISRMDIALEDTAIYGTSAGGFLSIMMGIYLRGAKVVADNGQLDIRKWIFKDALDAVLTFSFDHIGDALNYRERFNIIDAFEQRSYVPKIYLHVNLCSQADNSRQLVPFLKNAERMRQIKAYNDIEVFLHYAPEKGHEGISQQEAVNFLYRILEVGGNSRN